MAQPVWKTIVATDYSRVKIDETGEYAPEMEIAQESENERFDVYRFSLDKLQAVKVQGPPSSMQPLLAMAAVGNPEAIEIVRDWLEERQGWRLSFEYTMQYVRNPPQSRTYLLSAGWDPSWISNPVNSYEEWFVEDLDRVARSSGTSRPALVAALTSDDPLKRAWAYESVGSFHGFENLDTDPLRGLTEKQLDSRWST